MIKLLLAAKILAHIMFDCQVVLSNVYKTSESFFPYVFVLGGGGKCDGRECWGYLWEGVDHKKISVHKQRKYI